MSRTKTLALLLLILLGLPLLHACGDKQTEEARREAPPVPVILGEASTRRVELTLEQVGTLTASQDVTLRAESEGRVVAMTFREGLPVQRGEVLVRLDAEQIEASILGLEARLVELNARLENQQRTLERNRPLLERNLISRLQFDNLETDILQTRAQIEAVRSHLAQEQVRLAATRIRAPFAGVVGARTLAVGDYLRVGDPVVSIVDLDPLEITFQVPEALKPKIFREQQVSLRVAPYPERVFAGRISFIAPRVDIDTRTFQVKAQVDNAERLLSPGMFARVEVITDVFEQALTVPWESVIRTEDDTYVYTVENGLARRVSVRLGRVTAQWVQVLEGELAPGAPVILEGKFAARDGMKVAPQQPAPRASGD
ncbi:efflux RND transporter periplasmic adaptor subunit [Geoalkalibacter sp.]|uniref:efflux RND transporter periplasmic adaptor subunit n=1 Tax=Geoalkalibacter sp. TaxID=3041440 RepID=UPI00272DCB8A|nr:efflux RND transporter periplasmic adaptor subunit [Geoalkalibacter sp.]